MFDFSQRLFNLDFNEKLKLVVNGKGNTGYVPNMGDPVNPERLRVTGAENAAGATEAKKERNTAVAEQIRAQVERDLAALVLTTDCFCRPLQEKDLRHTRRGGIRGVGVYSRHALMPWNTR